MLGLKVIGPKDLLHVGTLTSLTKLILAIQPPSGSTPGSGAAGAGGAGVGAPGAGGGGVGGGGAAPLLGPGVGGLLAGTAAGLAAALAAAASARGTMGGTGSIAGVGALGEAAPFGSPFSSPQKTGSHGFAVGPMSVGSIASLSGLRNLSDHPSFRRRRAGRPQHRLVWMDGIKRNERGINN